MKNTLKKLVMILLCVSIIATFALVACGDDNKTSSSSSTPAVSSSSSTTTSGGTIGGGTIGGGTSSSASSSTPAGPAASGVITLDMDAAATALLGMNGAQGWYGASAYTATANSFDFGATGGWKEKCLVMFGQNIDLTGKTTITFYVSGAGYLKWKVYAVDGTNLHWFTEGSEPALTTSVASADYPGYYEATFAVADLTAVGANLTTTLTGASFDTGIANFAVLNVIKLA